MCKLKQRLCWAVKSYLKIRWWWWTKPLYSKKVDVSSTFIENIFRSGLTLVSSWDCHFYQTKRNHRKTKFHNKFQFAGIFARNCMIKKNCTVLKLDYPVDTQTYFISQYLSELLQGLYSFEKMTKYIYSADISLLFLLIKGITIFHI